MEGFGQVRAGLDLLLHHFTGLDGGGPVLQHLEGQDPDGDAQGRDGSLDVDLARQRLRDEEFGDVQQRGEVVSAAGGATQTTQDRIDLVIDTAAQSSHCRREMVALPTDSQPALATTHLDLSLAGRVARGVVCPHLRRVILLHPAAALLSVYSVRITTGRHPGGHAGRRHDAVDCRHEHEGESGVDVDGNWT